MRFALAFLFTISLSASPLLVSTSGTFTAATPRSSFTAPNASWSLSLETDSNPAVSNGISGDSFDAAFSNFSYILAGSLIALELEAIFGIDTAGGIETHVK